MTKSRRVNRLQFWIQMWAEISNFTTQKTIDCVEATMSFILQKSEACLTFREARANFFGLRARAFARAIVGLSGSIGVPVWVNFLIFLSVRNYGIILFFCFSLNPYKILKHWKWFVGIQWESTVPSIALPFWIKPKKFSLCD